jgi:CubicO group peptidase (beta-lactamase class C family)
VPAYLLVAAGPIHLCLFGLTRLQAYTIWLAKLDLEVLTLRSGLVTLLIAATLWLPLPANAKSLFVGIDGRALTPAEIDATITRVMQGAEVPGLALALIQHGKVVYLKAYGVKNTSPNEPLTVNSVMVAGSP